MEEEKFLDFRKILAIMEKNFTVLTRDKVRMMPLIMFPIFMILIFGYTTGNVPKHITTAVIDYDNSQMSQMIIKQISSSNVFSIRHMVSTEGEARRLLDSGNVRVIIIIPPDLEKNVNSNIQQGITIVVDESDSAVAATAKQTLSTIVNAIAYKLSLKKFAAYQYSVGNAVENVKTYVGMQPIIYDNIVRSLNPATKSVMQAKKITEEYTNSLVSTLSGPTLFIQPDRDINFTFDSNVTFVTYPVGYDALQAQIALLRKTGLLMESAQAKITSALIAAKQADSRVSSLNSYQSYNSYITQPSETVALFTQSDPVSTIKPLLYEEKPAYGTGKRAIEFAIPAIIALTIFQGAILGMGRAIAGEKRDGSLTRVFLTPTSNATIITGTLSFYIVFELFRSAFLLLVAITVFQVAIEGNLLTIALVLAIFAGVSTSIGMIISSMVKTEQQFQGMAMLVTLPTIFLSGAFFPVQAMPRFFQIMANFLPVTYAADALRSTMIKGFSLSLILSPLSVLCLFLITLIAIVFLVFKRDIE